MRVQFGRFSENVPQLDPRSYWLIGWTPASFYSGPGILPQTTGEMLLRRTEKGI